MTFRSSTLSALLASLCASSRARQDLCSDAPADGSRSFASYLMPAVYANDGTSGSFSPTSLRQAFFMVGQGAGETDANEIKTTMKACSESAEFADLASPVTALQHSSQYSNLTIANAMFVDETFEVKQEYADALAEYWGAQAMTVDFANEPTEAKDAINAFVKDKTRDIIPAILSGDPALDTVMFLVNALYFGAQWMKPFQPAWSQRFTDPARGVAVLAEMMTEILTVPYVNGGTYTAASLPYKEGGYEMLLIKPGGCTDESIGQEVHLRELVNTRLDRTMVDAMSRISNVVSTPTKVKVTLPRFHVKWRSEKNLKSTLMDLGMQKVFSPSEADLSGISDATDLFVSQVVHQADVRVNEQGTEAAAATAVGFSATSFPVDPPDSFVLDEPFLYAIYHQPTSEVLFSGWVNEDALEVTGNAEFEAVDAGACPSGGKVFGEEDTKGTVGEDDPSPASTKLGGITSGLVVSLATVSFVAKLLA